MALTLELPWPPTANHLHTVARGRKIKSATGRAYDNEVAWRITTDRRANPEAWRPTRTDRLAVTLDAYAPDNRRRDLDNLSKAINDAVAAALGFDDSQIDVLTLRRRAVDRTNPRITLTLETIPAELPGE